MSLSEMSSAERKFRSGDYAGTLVLLNETSGLGTDPDLMDLLGDCFDKLDLKSDAAAVFEQAADQFAGRRLHFLKKSARLFLETGEKLKAEHQALHILRLDPQDPDAAFVLIHVLCKPEDRVVVEHLKYHLIASDTASHLELAQELCGTDLSDARLLPLFRKLTRLKPHDNRILSMLAAFAREYADYDTLDRIDFDTIEETPLDRLLWCGNDAENRARHAVRPAIPFDPAVRAHRRSMSHPGRDRLKIGYLSSDFRPDHVVMRQLGGVLRNHDRTRFEVTLFCNASDKDGTKAHDLTPYGHVVDIARLTDARAAQEIRRQNLDILVELNGYTGGSRASLLNVGLTPVQVSWLGYPDSAVGLDSDYIVTDTVVTPEASTSHFAEKFCNLPDTYMPNDPMARPLPQDVARSVCGLPENAFVFASFNAPRKLTARVIALWARILAGTPGSLLWLAARTSTTEFNLRRRFEILGIDPSRIVFASTVRSYQDHISRMRTADVGLDPFPYNGHATTSDGLWAGLPIIALKGSNFASRVSESQLRAAGLQDLIAQTEDAYCALAETLFADPDRLGRLRDILDETRHIGPLFDAERFCRHLEKGYEMMADRAKSGLGPDHLHVPPLPRRTRPFHPE